MEQISIAAMTSRITPQASPKDKELKEVIGKVVGSVFYGTLLRTMRDSTIKGKYGHGGRGEEIFSAQLHDLLAERMGASSNNGLTKGLYRSLARNTNAATANGLKQESVE